MDTHTDNHGLCEPAAFRLTFDAHYKMLRNFLLFRYRDNDLADDIAQNAFVKLWENCAILKKEQAKSFLFTTAIRLSLNQLKHQKVVADYQLQLEPKIADKESPQFLMEETEFRQQLERAIGALPERQREVFMLNRFESQSYTEIAALLNLSVKAVEKRMHQALVTLRKTTPKI
ncbi:MAG: RNA polymerase subunit sigma-70 [Flavobacterium sp. BFFFF1]|uniref:RNA polymerase sigma factor n=1 Tax=Flavobacterium sp. BFFFF1 TaxID=2015557 RepID=UPI000BD37446|nr:sigma-70 family RNA polymerase sigma factor [Flavobacterium sp. BFFFF1]OYU80833.1 MAG: RNA polymerase subunit sigma-70 [Flavobacterium sp. BFFFF1]